MVLKFLKDTVEYLIYQVKYSHAKIAFGGRINKGSSLGKNTTIGKNSIVNNSKIGDSVYLGNSCSVSNSLLGKSLKVNKLSAIEHSQLNQNVVVYENCYLSKVKIGKFSYIAKNSSLSLVELGNFCSVGSDLICGQGDHPTNFVSTNPVFFSTLKQCGVTFTNQNSFEERKKIIIGHDVWIGARVFIKDGVKIGNGAIIGAGAVVVKDVPDYAIVGGVPAKIIRFRFTEEIIQQLLKIQWWNWSEEKLRQAQPYFDQKDIFALIKWTQINSLDITTNKDLKSPTYFR